MGIMDKMSKTLGLSSSEEEKDLETNDKDELKAPSFAPPKEQSAASAPPNYAAGRNVVDFNSAISARDNSILSKPKTSLVKSKITTVTPKDFNDAQTVANCLRDKIPVILNFENTSTEDAKRIIDFISGTTYAIQGEIKRVSQNVFVCAPNNVTVTYTEEDKKSSPGELSWLTK